MSPGVELADQLPAIVSAARQARRLVLTAPPGSGKTTLVAPALAKSGVLDPAHPAVLLLQPRRIAARAVAARIAQLNQWRLGREVGHQVRFESTIGPRSIVRVVTEGILNRMILSDPFLEGIGAVILDEFHERSIHTDLAIALTREVADAVRPDLIVVVMSATLDPEPIARFLGNAPVFHAPGRRHPITLEYRGGPSFDRRYLAERVACEVLDELRAHPATRRRSSLGCESLGDILVFLPGIEEIRRAMTVTRTALERDDRNWSEWVTLCPLHGRLSAAEQDAALVEDPQGRRKVVFSTNVAETSLTIPGVRLVIDSGLARVATVDHRKGLDRLELTRISRASADQRAGRAGRVGPGRCVRLWSEAEHRALAEFETPEIHRVDLTGPCLTIHRFGCADPAALGWFEPPRPEALEAAQTTLARLKAIDPITKRITPLGQRLAELPTHPRLARLVLAAADEGFAWYGATLAALLAEADPALAASPNASGSSVPRHPALDRPGSSDVLARLDIIDEAERLQFDHEGCRRRGISAQAARNVARARDNLLKALKDQAMLNKHSDIHQQRPSEDLMLQWLLIAFPDRLVRLRGGDERVGVMVGGRGVRLDGDSVVQPREWEFLLAHDPFQDRRDPGAVLEARVRLASGVRWEWLTTHLAEHLRRETLVQFDESRAKVVGIARTTFLGLTLCEEPHVAISPEQAGEALATWLAPRIRDHVRNDPVVARWLARLEFARQVEPQRDWPSLEDDDWIEAIRPLCHGKRHPDEVSMKAVVERVEHALGFETQRRLDQLAPETITLPNGRQARLSYETGRPPTLSIKLQELFGWRETPRVGDGRVPLRLEILGPHHRPVQVTDDLQGFWTGSYARVRKELRGRYPKHAWPERPWEAEPHPPRSGRTPQNSATDRQPR